MSNILKPNKEKVVGWLSIPKRVVILSHRNPDGDALGSSLAWKHILEKLGHTVQVLLPSEFPLNFKFLPGSDDVLIYDLHQEECLRQIERADLYFYLDFNSIDRIDKMGEAIHAGDHKLSVMIDHHLDPEPIAEEVYSDPSRSSTCEMLYEFIHFLGYEKYLDQAICECIFTGLITDTGRFRFATSPELFSVAAALKSHGVRDTMINNFIFNNYTEKQLRLLGYCLYKRLEVLEDYSTAIISLSKKDYSYFKIGRGDTEGIVNYMLSMPNIKLAAFITEQPTIIKYSFRSKGDISVQKIASEHFNGGGHFNASGGYSYGSLSKAIDKFKKIIPTIIESNNPIKL